MAIAAAQASAMVGAIGRGLVAACDRLPVVIAEATCHTRSKPGVVQRAKEMIQPHFEASVDPSDHVLHHGHASFFGGMWILPGEVLIHELRNSFRDSAALAVLLDCRLDLFLHFDGIDLPRAFVHRPEILVDALFAQDAHSSEATSGLTFTSASASGTFMTGSATAALVFGSASAVLNSGPASAASE